MEAVLFQLITIFSLLLLCILLNKKFREFEIGQYEVEYSLYMDSKKIKSYMKGAKSMLNNRLAWGRDTNIPIKGEDIKIFIEVENDFIYLGIVKGKVEFKGEVYSNDKIKIFPNEVFTISEHRFYFVVEGGQII